MSFRSKVPAFVKKYRWRLGGALLGVPAGLWGIATGFLAGFFAEIIFRRRGEENALLRFFEDPSGVPVDEPFPAAAAVCGLCLFCTEDVSAAVRAVSLGFPGRASDDVWFRFAGAASRASPLNPDILCEYVASRVKKEKNPAAELELLNALRAAELCWNEEKRGEPPSSYLSRLLGLNLYAEDSLAEAFAVLGVSESVSEEELKAVHRRLAAAYHPDAVRMLSAVQQKEAAEAFIRIENAYRLIIENRKLHAERERSFLRRT